MIKEKLNKKIEELYDFINNEKGTRSCKGIDENACRYLPGNYFLILISSTLSQLGDALSNPKTVLAWLMSYVGAPLYLISFIVPIRESGSMLPQIFISGYISKKAIRKWVWVMGSFLQFLSISVIGLVALTTEGSKAGWYMIICLIAFSLARGLCSIVSKDMLGKTIPKSRRGILKGYSVSFAGIFVLMAGLFMIYKSNDQQDVQFYSSIILFAGFLWLLAALVYANIKEFPGETSGGKNSLKQILVRMNLIRNDKIFRNFIISRSLLLCSALTAPFYILLAQKYLGKESYLLGLFVIANGIASIISAPFWGKMADISSKGVMVRGAIIASVLGIFVFAIVTWMPGLRTAYWLYPAGFFILGIAHSGVRLGRKTYVVNMAEGNKRTDYVAVSNTIIGFVLLITGGISALASLLSIQGIILALSLLGIAGAYTSSKLPNVE